MAKSAALSDKFFERLERNFVDYADKVAISYNGDERQITYGELNEISARVHGYLKAKGLKPDDFVMIKLPRGAEAGAVAIGVLRAGIAYTLCEEGYPQERIDFIYKDCGCKLCIDSAAYKEILNADPVYGFEEADDHKAAIATYTSGTTGNPKGVLLERGRILEGAESISYNGKLIYQLESKFAYLSPLNFVAFFNSFCAALFQGAEILVIGYSIVKNLECLEDFFCKNKVDITFLTPSYARLFKNFNPEFKILFLSSEPARNIYYDNIVVYNVFAQSETGYMPSIFKVDKPYELTPIGRSCENIKLLDENGREVKPGELGEICIRNEYFRGYINRPEENERAFRGGIYHTGDLGRLLEDGSIVLSGRADDMVKINGNRVEPAEIEEVVKNAFGISWAAAKVVDKNGHKSVCAYYVDEPKTDIEEAKRIIASKLPAYMVPANYMQIVKIPLNANGKFNRRNLPEPEGVEDIQYIPPSNDIEKTLCRAMADVMGLDYEKTGIKSDFFLSGGTSLIAMKFVARAKLKQLTVMDVYNGRTIEGIAGIIQKKSSNNINTEEMDTREYAARQKSYHLSAMQLLMMDSQFYKTKGEMWNIAELLRFNNTIDTDRLCSAVNQAIKNHPSLLSIIYAETNGDMFIKYAPELFKDICVEYVSENDFESIKNTLIKPYKLIKSLLHRARVFKTEKYCYLFFDVHHIIADGRSLDILFNDIFRAYKGENLRTDCYYSHLAWLEAIKNTDEFIRAEKYFIEKYGNTGWTVAPVPDKKTGNEIVDGMFNALLDAKVSDIKAAEKHLKISRNAITTSAAMIALADITGEKNIYMQWLYDNRTDLNLGNAFGNLIKSMPVATKLKAEYSLKEILQEVNRQISDGIANSAYDFNMAINSNIKTQALEVNYLQDIGQAVSDNDASLVVTIVPLADSERLAGSRMELYISESDNQIQLSINYLASMYNESTIKKYSELFNKYMNKICNIRTV